MRYLFALLVLAITTRPLAGQSDTSITPVQEGSLPVLVLLVEAIAIGSGAAARSETGARVTGAIQGVSGLTVLGIAALTDRRRGAPEFLVPYGLGLVGLSYYNFASASSQNDDARFWTNVLGFNIAVVAGVLGSRVWHNDQRVTIHVAPSRVFAAIRF
jgi:hypothetical protein